MITEQIGSYHLLIQGVRDARLGDPEKTLNDLRRNFEGVDLQLLRADRVAGKEHLVFAANNAINSFKGTGRKAKHLSMEFLLFASGEHQIVEAIKLLGVVQSIREIVFAGFSERQPDTELLTGKVAEAVRGASDDSVIDLQNAKKIVGLKKAYRISNRQLESARVPTETDEMVLQRLVIERSAILVLEN